MLIMKDAVWQWDLLERGACYRGWSYFVRGKLIREGGYGATREGKLIR